MWQLYTDTVHQQNYIGKLPVEVMVTNPRRVLRPGIGQAGDCCYIPISCEVFTTVIGKITVPNTIRGGVKNSIVLVIFCFILLLV